MELKSIRINKDDQYYIEKVVHDLDIIIEYTNHLEYEQFVNNSMLIDATMFRLVQMAENIIHISKEFKETHRNIKWRQIIGFRNGIVHDYGKTDYSIVYEIVSKDIYELRQNLVDILLKDK